MINEFVLGVAVILLTGLLFGKIAKFIKVPNITGYLIGGLIIGPVLINWIIPSFSGIIGVDLLKTLAIVTEIELGFIAFTVGSEFKISYFKQVGIMPVVIAFAESLAAVIFITAGVFLIGMPFGVPFWFALALGAVGGATAPAATIMVIRQYRANGPLAKTLLSVVAIDDASALIFFGIAIAIVKAIVNPGQNIAMSIVMPFIEIGGSLLLGCIVGLLLVVLIKPFSSKGNRIVLVIAMIFLNIGIYILIKEKIIINGNLHITLSPLLACMATGAVFTNMSKTVEEVMPLIDHITPPLVVIFFIMAGATLEVGMISGLVLLLLAVYLVFRVAGKVLGTLASAKVCKAPPVIKKWLGFGLLPQGGIAIGLSALVAIALPAAEEGIFKTFNGELIRAIVLLAVFASEIFGPILCKYALIKSGEAQVDVRQKKKKAIVGGGASTSGSTPPSMPPSASDTQSKDE